MLALVGREPSDPTAFAVGRCGANGCCHPVLGIAFCQTNKSAARDVRVETPELLCGFGGEVVAAAPFKAIVVAVAPLRAPLVLAVSAAAYS